MASHDIDVLVAEIAFLSTQYLTQVKKSLSRRLRGLQLGLGLVVGHDAEALHQHLEVGTGVRPVQDAVLDDALLHRLAGEIAQVVGR